MCIKVCLKNYLNSVEHFIIITQNVNSSLKRFLYSSSVYTGLEYTKLLKLLHKKHLINWGHVRGSS